MNSFITIHATLYRFEHHHSGFKILTPVQRHNREENAIMENRNLVYEAAKATLLERCNGFAIGDWLLSEKYI